MEEANPQSGSSSTWLLVSQWRGALRGDTKNGCVADYLISGRTGIWKCWFLRRGENWRTRKKPLGAKEKTNNKVNPHHIGGMRAPSLASEFRLSYWKLARHDLSVRGVQTDSGVWCEVLDWEKLNHDEKRKRKLESSDLTSYPTPHCFPCSHLFASSPQSEGDVTRDDSQRRFFQCWNIVATLCCVTFWKIQRNE